jgi:hypothetical protein
MSLPNGSTSFEEQGKLHLNDTTKSGDAATAATAVLKPSIPMPSTSTKIRGVDFNDYLSTPITVAQLTSHFSRTGFQASSLSRAIEIINNMVVPLIPHVNCRDNGNLDFCLPILMMPTKNRPRQMQSAPSS